MSRSIVFLAVVLACGTYISSARAGDAYGGILFGAVATHGSIEPLAGTPPVAGFRAGFNLGVQGMTGVAIECDGLTTITGGDVNASGTYAYDYYAQSELTRSERDELANHWSWGLSSVAMYGVARLGEADAGRGYFKVKAGLILGRLGVDTARHESSANAALSIGLGIGADLGRDMRLEMELVTVDENMAHVQMSVGRRI